MQPSPEHRIAQLDLERVGHPNADRRPSFPLNGVVTATSVVTIGGCCSAAPSNSRRSCTSSPYGTSQARRTWGGAAEAGRGSDRDGRTHVRASGGGFGGRYGCHDRRLPELEVAVTQTLHRTKDVVSGDAPIGSARRAPERSRLNSRCGVVVAHGGPAGAVPPGALSALLADIVRSSPEAPLWSRSLRPGVVIGRFELVKELGRGGFGAVWEAKDRELGRAVAFKAVLAGTPNAREERILREAETAARLSHPNIVTLFDVGRTEDGPYLVLELLRGATLARRLEQGPLPEREALRIAVEVAKGLAHAHAEGVVHRDLTPGNVFLCEDGQVKILDRVRTVARERSRLRARSGVGVRVAHEPGIHRRLLHRSRKVEARRCAGGPRDRYCAWPRRCRPGARLASYGVIWDWPGARADLERAIALAPGESIHHSRYSDLLAHARPAARRNIGGFSRDGDRSALRSRMVEVGRLSQCPGRTRKSQGGIGQGPGCGPGYLLAARERALTALLTGEPALALASADALTREYMRLTAWARPHVRPRRSSSTRYGPCSLCPTSNSVTIFGWESRAAASA
jgi:protein kinase-like protein